MSPLNLLAPLESLTSTLCGTASLLLKWIVNGASAGAVALVCSKAMFSAEIWTAPPAPLSDGAAEALPLGAADAPLGAADAPLGAADAPLEAAADGDAVGAA